MLTTDMAARLLGCSRATVFRMLKNGRLRSLSPEDVAALIYERGYRQGRLDAYTDLKHWGYIKRRSSATLQRKEIPTALAVIRQEDE